MRISEWEAGGAVIELAIGPDRDGMAGGAGRCAGGETRRYVIRNISADGLRAVPGGLVTAHAIR